MTSIEWTHPPGYRGESWNPTTGCSHVSAGCDNCYAASFAHRGLSESHVGLTVRGQKGPLSGKIVFNGQIKLHEDRLDIPLRRRKPTCFFVDSMSDLFHEKVPFDFVDQVMAAIALCPQHRFIVLTKRPERMREYFEARTLAEIIADMRALDDWPGMRTDIAQAVTRKYATDDIGTRALSGGNRNPFEGTPSKLPQQWPLPNLILGVSCEDQATADERIPPLLATPAATRCLSCEPLLGAIDLGKAAQGSATGDQRPGAEPLMAGGRSPVPSLDWIISGGESGPSARPSHADWHRSLRDQCAVAGIPYFFKQWGAWAPGACAQHPQTRTETGATWDCGRWFFMDMTPAESESMREDDGPDVYRFGKKRAGRFLDGRTHDEYPAALGQSGDLKAQISEGEAVEAAS